MRNVAASTVTHTDRETQSYTENNYNTTTLVHAPRLIRIITIHYKKGLKSCRAVQTPVEL